MNDSFVDESGGAALTSSPVSFAVSDVSAASSMSGSVLMSSPSLVGSTPSAVGGISISFSVMADE